MLMKRQGGMLIALMLTGLMVGEQKAVSRGGFGYNGPCGCAPSTRPLFIYYTTSIYVYYNCLQNAIEHLFCRSAVVRSPYPCSDTCGSALGITHTVRAVDSGSVSSA